jgi:hypothetical protein
MVKGNANGYENAMHAKLKIGIDIRMRVVKLIDQKIVQPEVMNLPG